MKNDSSVARYFKNHWTKIKQLFNNGLLCSESHLQAELFHLLYSDGSFKSRYKLFIEPKIWDDNGTLKKHNLKGIIPDMIVADRNKRIVAIVELKYVLHSYVKFEKDIKNLTSFYEIKDLGIPFLLQTDKNSGGWDTSKKYFLDNDLELIYGIIGKKDSSIIANPQDVWKNQIKGHNKTPKFEQCNLKVGSNPQKWICSLNFWR